MGLRRRCPFQLARGKPHVPPSLERRLGVGPVAGLRLQDRLGDGRGGGFHGDGDDLRAPSGVLRPGVEEPDVFIFEGAEDRLKIGPFPNPPDGGGAGGFVELAAVAHLEEITDFQIVAGEALPGHVLPGTAFQTLHCRVEALQARRGDPVE